MHQPMFLNECRKTGFTTVLQGYYKALMDTSNYKLGKLGDNSGIEYTMDREGIGHMSKKRELFVGFCRSQDLAMGDTLFPLK